jgi:hypothetical protein
MRMIGERSGDDVSAAAKYSRVDVGRHVVVDVISTCVQACIAERYAEDRLDGLVCQVEAGKVRVVEDEFVADVRAG